MFARLQSEPGLLYVAATLSPLAAFVAMLLLGLAKNMGRRYQDQSWGNSLYWLLGGDYPGTYGAAVATTSIGFSFVLSVTGLVWFLHEYPVVPHEHAHVAEHGHDHNADAKHAPGQEEQQVDDHGHAHNAGTDAAWTGSATWAQVGGKLNDTKPGLSLHVGYRIDHLAAIMFAMVTLIATLIHIFASAYMGEEAAEVVEDHEVHGADGGHLKRRGRYNRFFLYFSLFCFSMLNLVLADNLFQVFVSWELVGICSFGLIGFYYERHSASTAANKAFITNRVGDAGFIIGLMIVWTHLGTLNFQEIFTRLRAPEGDAHGEALPGIPHGSLVRVSTIEGKANTVHVAPTGDDVLLFPGHMHSTTLEHDFRVNNNNKTSASTMPYWLLTLAGLGIFLGCVGKSAQFPLQVWLPDAMEGPTPVSALVHSATMVAAGVYLVGRCFPVFTPEARIVIAYVGGITLFVAATIAIVATDIKKVLAYSTISQLGYMMLALGIGGWVAGLLHLLTHAFFKALLFLCSGAVIYNCHHVQDMRRMGGLRLKMPITAGTMLVGSLAIAGIPTFSGWYSKDAIIASALGFTIQNPQHFLLLLLPTLTAGITSFYMFRMWFLTFTGESRDRRVADHAHESPWRMTLPLIVLAAFSYFVAYGFPVWDAEASYLGHALEMSEPSAVAADIDPIHAAAHHRVPAYHSIAGALALIAALGGIGFAYAVYYAKKLNPAETAEQFPGVYALLENKWYFDEVYSVLFIRPAVAVGYAASWFDRNAIDGLLHSVARLTLLISRWDGLFDRYIVDGFVNLVGNSIHATGMSLKSVQTGNLRSYVLFLVLAAVGLFAILTYFVGQAIAQ